MSSPLCATATATHTWANEEESWVTLLVGFTKSSERNTLGLVVSDTLVHSAGLLSSGETRQPEGVQYGKMEDCGNYGHHSPWLQGIDSDSVLGKLCGESLDHVGSSSLTGIVKDLGEGVVEALLVVELDRRREQRKCQHLSRT